MFKAFIDALTALAFWGMISFGVFSFYDWIKVETIKKVNAGLSDHYKFTRALTKKTFDWELDDLKK